MHAEVDATTWEPADEETIGTKPKQWLYEPRSESERRWLWKERTYNPAKGGQLQYAKGDDWAECVASDLGRQLGVPTPTVELATRREVLGTIALDFTASLAGSELHLGNELIAAIDASYPSGLLRDDRRYTLEVSIRALQDVDTPEQHEILRTARDWFAGYLLLDAWIGNTDRHHQNWGAISAPSLTHQILAPSFDHASSLGFLLSDEERAERLAAAPESGRDVETWADKAPTPFGDCRHPADAALGTLEILDPSVRMYWLEALSRAAPGTRPILGGIPETRISEPSNDFALRMLAHNASRLLSAGGLRMSK